MQHELKTLPEYFQAIWFGQKRFEVRLDDRGFDVGDTLVLREWEPGTPTENDPEPEGTYTGSAIAVVVDYIMRGPSYGLLDDWVCMSIRAMGDPAPQRCLTWVDHAWAVRDLGNNRYRWTCPCGEIRVATCEGEPPSEPMEEWPSQFLDGLVEIVRGGK